MQKEYTPIFTCEVEPRAVAIGCIAPPETPDEHKARIEALSQLFAKEVYPCQ